MPHPDHLLPLLTSAQLAEWEAFYQLEPFGPQAEDVRFAQLTALIANVNRAKGEPAVKVSDAMLGDQTKPEPTEDELRAKILGAFGIKQ